MTRAIALLVGLGSLALAQTANPQKKFLSELASQSASRIQEVLQVSESEAETLRSAAREYSSGALVVDEALKRATFERRMQTMAGEKLSGVPEAALVAQSNRQLEAAADKTMQELRSKLSDEGYRRLTSFIDEGSSQEEFFPRPKGVTKAVAR